MGHLVTNATLWGNEGEWMESGAATIDIGLADDSPFH